MQIAALYVVTVVLFLGLDAIGLRLLIRPMFERHVSELLLPGFRLAPAAVFYLFYIAGVVWFAGLPALRAGAPWQAALQGAAIGALAYGTYEFTNYATLRAWAPAMVAVDLAWGTALTGVSAWLGVWAARALG